MVVSGVKHPVGCTSAHSSLFHSSSPISHVPFLQFLSFSFFLPVFQAFANFSLAFSPILPINQWFCLLSAMVCVCVCVSVGGGLTLWEARRIVINVCDHNGDCGGSRETTHLSCHVCCLDDQLITILCFTVQICHRCHDDP